MIDSPDKVPARLSYSLPLTENVSTHRNSSRHTVGGQCCGVVSHEDLGGDGFSLYSGGVHGQALLDIAKLYRDSFDMKVVGITGSAAKTSTKEMIASVLAQNISCT